MKNLHDKLTLYGASSLTDAELIAILLDDMALAERLTAAHSLSELQRSDISRLRMQEGIGLARAAKISAAVEIGRRSAKCDAQKVTHILSSNDAEAVFRPLFNGVNHEECWVIFLTSSARIVDRMKISQGGVQATVVDNKLIFKRAIELLATQIIIAHNHPSGTAEPSQADIALTNRIKAAAALFDINLIDHLIITTTGCYSFKSHRLL